MLLTCAVWLRARWTDAGTGLPHGEEKMLRRPNQGAGCLSEAQTWGCGLGRSLWGLRPMGPGPLSSLLSPTRCLGPSRAAAPSPAGSLSPICRLSASQLGSWSVGGGGAPLTHIPCAGKAGAAGSVGGVSRATGLSQPLRVLPCPPGHPLPAAPTPPAEAAESRSLPEARPSASRCS